MDIDINTAIVHNQIELKICTTRPLNHRSLNPFNTCIGVGNKCVVPTLHAVQKVSKIINQPTSIVDVFEVLSSSNGLKNFFICFNLLVSY